MAEEQDQWKITFESNLAKFLKDLKSLATRTDEVEKGMERTDTIIGRVGSRLSAVGTSGAAALKSMAARFTEIRAELQGTNKDLAFFITGVDEATKETILLVDQWAKVAGATFETTARQLRDKEYLGAEQFKAVMSGYRTAMKNAEEYTTGFQSALNLLGSTAKTVIGGILGFLGIRTLTTLARKFKELAEYAAEYQFATFRLAVAVRSFQRVAGDAAGTIAQWEGFITDLQKEFRIFTTQDIRDAVASTILLTRELGFSQEQMEDFTRAAVILAEVNGKTVVEAINTMRVALSGQRRGLRSMGVAYGDAQIRAEAMRIGLLKQGEEITEQAKAIASLNLILEQVAPLEEDAARAAESFKGQLLEAKATVADAGALIGNTFVPVLLGLNKAWAWIVTQIARAAVAFQQWASVASGGFVIIWETVKALGEIRTALHRGAGIEEIREIWARATEEMIQKSDEVVIATAEAFGLFPVLGEDAEQSIDRISEAAEELRQTLLRITTTVQDELMQAWENYYKGIEDAQRDYQRRSEDLQLDYLQRLEDAHEDYQDRLADLQLKTLRQQEDAYDDYAKKLRNIDRDLQRKREDIYEDFREEELQSEEEFQRDLARLHAQYVLSLYDALQTRDARAILQIQRRYRQRRQEMIEDYEAEKEIRQENLEDELREAEEWAVRMREEAKEWLEERLEDIKIANEDRQKELAKDYKRRLADMEKSLRRQKQDLKDSYRDRLLDLRRSLEDRAYEIGRAIANEEDLTLRGAWAVYRRLFEVFGSAGLIDQLMQGFTDRMEGQIWIDITTSMAEAPPEEPWVPPPDYPGLPEEPWRTPTAEPTDLIAPTTLTRMLEPTVPVTTDLESTLLTRSELLIHITADEHFSADFESRLYGELVTAIRPLTDRIADVRRV